jgi:microcystin-dependent protein
MPTIENLSSNIKPGTVMAFPANQIPIGWLICNGATYDRTAYNKLFSVIGTTYGAGDGSTTFNVPDFQGKFLRGVGGNAAGIGSTQGDAIRNITGSIYNLKGQWDPNRSDADGCFSFDNQGAQSGYSTSTMETFHVHFSASNVVPTAVENRPINMAVVYCIKY